MATGNDLSVDANLMTRLFVEFYTSIILSYFDRFLKYSQLCLIQTSVIRTFANSHRTFRSLEILLTKNLCNSNFCDSNFLYFEHSYGPPQSSNSTELTVRTKLTTVA